MTPSCVISLKAQRLTGRPFSSRLHPMSEEKRIVIIGAGATGLGAGYRLRELGYRNFLILEGRDKVGGLASSEKSPNGFTYDIGGGGPFSQSEYFHRLFDKLVHGEDPALAA